MSTATLDFESYAIVGGSAVGGQAKHGWMVSWRKGAVITQQHLGTMTADEAKAKAAELLPGRDILGPDDPKPWD